MRREIWDQLEGEGKVGTIGTSDFKKKDQKPAEISVGHYQDKWWFNRGGDVPVRIRNRRNQKVLKMKKMQSGTNKTPEPKLTSCDVLENEDGGRLESDVPKTLHGSRKSQDSDKS